MRTRPSDQHAPRDVRAHIRSRKAATSALALLSTLLLTGCAAEAPAEAPVEAPAAVPPAPEGSLPPLDTAELAVEPLLAALFAETGTLLTRGAVVERRTLVTSRGPSGYGPRETTAITHPHLALYLALVDEDLDDPARYLDALVPLTRAFAAAAFERWPDLESFDICLVPSSDSDATPEPALALVDVTRDGHALWLAAGGDLEAMLELTEDRSNGVRGYLSEPLDELLAARRADAPA